MELFITVYMGESTMSVIREEILNVVEFMCTHVIEILVVLLLV